MRLLAPRRTGRLAASISKTVSGFEATIGPKAPHAIYVEYGVRPHEIRPVQAHALRFEIEGEVIFAMRVSHPGTRPQPFIRETAQMIPSQIPETWERVWEEVNRR